MLEAIKGFSEGPGYHLKGVRFGFQHPGFLALALLPFLCTLAFYVTGFLVFAAHLKGILTSFWHVPADQSSRWLAWLYWAYTHLIRYILYLILLAVMFYTFIIVSNIVASPLYDRISEKYENAFYSERLSLSTYQGRNIFFIIKEEIKKAAFMLVIPLVVLFIPIIGGFLSLVVAAAFVAWDYVDFSLARDYPLLRDRLKALWKHKLRLIGFGWPLLVPVLGLAILPFAIFGSTKLYYEQIKYPDT
ncbi:MAG: EI24 domain-containing protein [Deltaproteobacteria bacterium]|nr:EI24 domain-containing protein [Deltaproteobacteria bacterium]